ncbi:MAG TPA: hypothetical protein VEI03_05025 [Stellaceae bacterium]|nr:hypothetical protein [Stellaceae bacterium]
MLPVLLLLLAPAACDSLKDTLKKVREESPTERCGELMQYAFPGGDIEVTKTSVLPVETESIATVVAAAEGTRKNLAPGGVPLREVAVECRFDDGILTGFRWTKGPLR